MSSSSKTEPVAIISMGCVLPNAFDVDHYWQTLLDGKVSFMKTPSEKWDSSSFFSDDRRASDKYYDDIVSYPHGFILPIDKFSCDADLVRNLCVNDQYTITALNECLSSLKALPENLKFYVGHTSVADYLYGPLTQSEILHDLTKGVADESLEIRLKNLLGRALVLNDPNSSVSEKSMFQNVIQRLINTLTKRKFPLQIIDAACASSLYAVESAIVDLHNRNIDFAICGGIYVSDPFSKVLFCRLGGSSRLGCFPFQNRADGTVFGDGSAFIAIKRLSDAKRDGDQIHAIIQSVGTASDGRGKSIYAPSTKGQILAMERAYNLQNIDPASIQFIEAHGTGTPAGDSTEFKSLQEYFGKSVSAPNAIGLGSVKSLFGHLGWTAGVASIIKMALSLKNKKITAQHHFEALSPQINLENSVFNISQQTKEWPENGILPRRAGINGFGFGGTNAHLIIEEFKDQPNFKPIEQIQKVDPIVIVGIGCVFPEANSWDEMKSMLKSNKSPRRHFEPAYRPNNIKFRIIEKSAAVIDNSQFMILEATLQSLKPIEHLLDHVRETTGVFVAQNGPLKKQLDHMKRIYADSIKFNLSKDSQISANETVMSNLQKMLADNMNSIPVPNEDSYPGIMPNVMAGRICNYFNFNGPNFTTNSGFSSFVQSLHTAISNLQLGRCRAAIVVTANTSTLPCHNELWQSWTNQSGSELTEGAISFALMRKSEAQAFGLQPIAEIEINAIKNRNSTSEVVFRKENIGNFPSPFGHLLSAPEAHLYLQAINGGKGKSALSTFEIRDEFESSWSVNLKTMDLKKRKFFLLDEIISQGESEFVAIRYLDKERDSYLDQHLVRGKPTLPGTFMIEMAAQIAKAWWPNLHLRKLSDIRFLKFIRQSSKLKMVAKLMRTDGLDKIINVQIFGQVIAKNGLVLQDNVLHFTCEIHLSEMKRVNLESAPVAQSTGRYLFDPFHNPESEVYLSGIFITISAMSTNGIANWGIYDLAHLSLGEKWMDFVLSPLLFDGALRLSAIKSERNAQALVPISLDSVEVFGELNDFELTQNRKVIVYYESSSDTCIISVDGFVAYRMKGLKGKPMAEAQGSDLIDAVSKKLTYKDALLDYKNIFITGATGLLGGQMAGEILQKTQATVTCLVRGRSQQTCRARLIAKLKEADLWHSDYDSRLRVVPGDLSKKRFGLSDHEFESLKNGIDHIFHVGAKIAWSHNYDALEATNVHSCFTILEMTNLENPVPISYISSVGVFFKNPSGPFEAYDEDADPRNLVIDFGGGYMESKRQAEKIMLDARDQGLPIKIFRPGTICGTAESGELSDDYFFTRAIQEIVSSGFACRSYNNIWDISPVDFVAQTILYLSNSATTDRPMFNIFNPSFRTTIELGEMIKSFGYPVEFISLQSWEDKICAALDKQSDHAFSDLKSFFTPQPGGSIFSRYFRIPPLSNFKTMSLIDGSGINCPPFDDILFRKYFDVLIEKARIRMASITTQPIEALEVEPVTKSYPPVPTHFMCRYLPSLRLAPISAHGSLNASDKLTVMSFNPFKDGVFENSPLQPFIGSYIHTLSSEYRGKLLLLFDLRGFPEPNEAPAQFLLNTEAISNFLHNLGQKLQIESPQTLLVHIAHSYNQEDSWHPALGLIRGFFRALAWESTNLKLQLILSDKSHKEMATNILAEYSIEKPDPVVMYKEDQRFTFDLIEKNHYSNLNPKQFKEDGVVLFCGGGRGIGGFLAQTLASRFPKIKLAILGRSGSSQFEQVKIQVEKTFGKFNQTTFIKYRKQGMGEAFSLKTVNSEFSQILAADESNEVLNALRATGVHFEYFSCDVTDANAMAQTIPQIYEKFGSIDTVIHCAGLEASKNIRSKSIEEFDLIQKIKINGFINLARNIDLDAISVWINFGSYVSFFGNDGQTDYTAANDCLNTLNLYYNKKFQNPRFFTLNWPIWQSVGMASRGSGLNEVVRERNLELLGSEDGANWFVNEILRGQKLESQIYFFPKNDLAFYKNRLLKHLGG